MSNDHIISVSSKKSHLAQLIIAKILISLSVYFFSTAVLLEHFSVITVLKSLAFMLSAHGFYFLWQYQKQSIL